MGIGRFANNYLLSPFGLAVLRRKDLDRLRESASQTDVHDKRSPASAQSKKKRLEDKVEELRGVVRSLKARHEQTLDALVRKNPITFDEIKEYVAREEPVILEIGCNDGSHTAMFLEAFPKGKVYAFEPDPRAIRKWRENITSPRASLTECALGAQDGIAQFHESSGHHPKNADDPRFVAHGWDASGSLRTPKKHLDLWPWVKFESTIDVQVRTLDGWAREHGIDHVDFIWADVQGAEGDLIAGGLNTLHKTRFFYTECSDHELYEGQVSLLDMLRLLEDCFELQTRWPEDALFKNTKLLAEGQS